MIWLLFSVITVTVVIIVVRKHKRPGRIMREGKLLKSEVVFRKGERFYVEKVAFKDWHASLHSFFLEDYTYALNRQVEVIALVRSLARAE